MERILLPLLAFLTVFPFFLGLGIWIYGRYKNIRKYRHNGFIMMMLTLLIIFLFVFTIGAVIFYMWLINR